MGLTERWNRKRKSRDDEVSDERDEEPKRTKKGRGFKKDRKEDPIYRRDEGWGGGGGGGGGRDDEEAGSSRSQREERTSYRPNERPPSPDRRPQDYGGGAVYSQRTYVRSEKGRIYGLANPDKAHKYTSSRYSSRGGYSSGGGGSRSGYAPSRDRDRESSRREDSARPSNKIFCGRLNFDTTADILQKAFSKYGEITDAFIPKNDQGSSKGFGFVTFASERDARDAYDAMQGADVDGNQISLEWAKPNGRSFGGGGGRSFGGGGGGSWGSSSGRGGFRGGGAGRGRSRDAGFEDRAGVTSKDLDDDLDAYFSSNK